MKKFEELYQEFNQLLEEAEQTTPMLSGAIIAGISYDLQNLTEEGWSSYGEETGNNRPIPPSTDPISKMIDKAAGLEEANKIAIGQFSVWYAKGFLEGFKK
jgi:hypothetical protein